MAPSVKDALDRALAEADELEATPDEEAEPEETPEPELEPEPTPEPASDALMEQIGRQLDAEAKRHEKAVAKIMGDQMGDLVTCPLCVTPGFVTVIPPEDFDPAQREAVLLAMGDNGPNSLKHHPRFVTCETCNGLGVLLTGANNEANYTVNCPDCQSRGYIDPSEVTAMAQAQLDAQPSYVPPAVLAPSVNTGNGVGGLPGEPDQQPWYDHVTKTWRLP